MIDLENNLRETLHVTAVLIGTSPDPWANYQQRTHRPPAGRRRVTIGLSLAGIAAATAGIIVLALVLSSAGNGNRSTGIAGGRSIVLTPSRSLSVPELRSSALVIQDRLRGLGVKDARVVVSGRMMTAQVPGDAVAQVGVAIAQPGVFRIRLVLASTASGVATPNSASASGPAQSPRLTKRFLKSYAALECRTHPNPTDGMDRASNYIEACDPGLSTKYLLAPSAVNNGEITSASATKDPYGQWAVEVTLDASGSEAWQKVTQKAYAVTQGQPSVVCSLSAGCNAVALSLDGVVVSAPYISQAGGIVGGHLEISGGFTHRDAQRVAAIVAHGPLLTSFKEAAASAGR